MQLHVLLNVFVQNLSQLVSLEQIALVREGVHSYYLLSVLPQADSALKEHGLGETAFKYFNFPMKVDRIQRIRVLEADTTPGLEVAAAVFRELQLCVRQAAVGGAVPVVRAQDQLGTN